LKNDKYILHHWEHVENISKFNFKHSKETYECTTLRLIYVD
jgi:hypothetical protein